MTCAGKALAENKCERVLLSSCLPYITARVSGCNGRAEIIKIQESLQNRLHLGLSARNRVASRTDPYLCNIITPVACVRALMLKSLLQARTDPKLAIAARSSHM